MKMDVESRLPARTISPQQKAARRILEECIADGLREVAGEDGYELVSKLHPLDLAAADPRKLHELLVSVFKEKGAVVIEREIAKRLLDRLAGDEPKPNAGHQEKTVDGEIREQVETLRRFAEVAGLPGAKGRARGRTADLGSTAVSFADAFTSEH
jgi:hypothetical protein